MLQITDRLVSVCRHADKTTNNAVKYTVLPEKICLEGKGSVPLFTEACRLSLLSRLPYANRRNRRAGARRLPKTRDLGPNRSLRAACRSCRGAGKTAPKVNIPRAWTLIF
jgi:hypothetical protein